MSCQMSGRVNGVVGSAFPTEAEAKAFIDEEIAEGLDNEANWLLELAHATRDGGAANAEDEGYVRRLLAVAEGARRAVAEQCVKERMCADCSIVKTV